jgi:hypothetical protein
MCCQPGNHPACPLQKPIIVVVTQSGRNRDGTMQDLRHDPNASSRAQGLEGKEISAPSGQGRKMSLTCPLIDQALARIDQWSTCAMAILRQLTRMHSHSGRFGRIGECRRILPDEFLHAERLLPRQCAHVVRRPVEAPRAMQIAQRRQVVHQVNRPAPL